jgi:hypothetical protein
MGGGGHAESTGDAARDPSGREPERVEHRRAQGVAARVEGEPKRVEGSKGEGRAGADALGLRVRESGGLRPGGGSREGEPERVGRGGRADPPAPMVGQGGWRWHVVG